jgi:HSP20 family protein
MGDLMERFFGPRDNWMMATDVFEPRINFVETDTHFETTVELPGMKPEDFHVELEGNELKISGEKKEEKEETGKTFHRVERRFGEFRRAIPLSTTVDADKIAAEYKDGVLTVTVPKTEAAKAKKIEIKT